MSGVDPNCDENRKRKCGWQKVKDKNQELMKESAKKNRKIDDMFSKVTPSTSNSNPTAESTDNLSSIPIVTEYNDNVPVIQQAEAMDTDVLELADSVEDSIGNNMGDENSLSNDENNDSIDCFARPSDINLESFIKMHPKQITNDPVLSKAFHRKNGSNRKWLTYCSQKGRFFCWICLAFSRNVDSPFTEGTCEKRHIHKRVSEHEFSNYHCNAAQSYTLYISKTDTTHLLFSNQMSMRREQVMKRRQILTRVIDVVKLIGKRGLSYRGSEYEAAHTLDDISVDHGNFLEIILLLSKYDLNLNEHINESIKASRARQQTNESGRGSLVTLLSKTTVNKVVSVIGSLIQRTIANEVQQAGMYSIQIDTTQDITAKDQCSIVLRYVSGGKINERLLFLIECEAATGEYFAQLVSEALKKININVLCCVGNATDGAANMNGVYNGFQAWVTKENPLQVHIWCFAHVLNLVMSDCTNSVLGSTCLFILINDISVFIRDSYLRMQVWDAVSSTDVRHRKLSSIGDTRWWSKDVALRKIFGDTNNLKSGLYFEVVETLCIIENDTKFKPDCRAKAKNYKDALLKFETIVTAVTFLRIFEITSPLSKYLQTVNMDMLAAASMINVTTEKLKSFQRDFKTVDTLANEFSDHFNAKLESIELEIEKAYIKKRNVSNAKGNYEINTYNVIMDMVVGSISRRYDSNSEILADISVPGHLVNYFLST